MNIKHLQIVDAQEPDAHICTAHFNVDCCPLPAGKPIDLSGYLDENFQQQIPDKETMTVTRLALILSAISSS
jgi:hypothetical protein